MYSATFDVTCDRCRIVYGREDEPLEEVAEGRWQGHAGLGSLRAGDQVRVILRVRPVGDARVLKAKMAVNGNTVATSGERKPGEPVDLIWMRVGSR